ncbi:triose-phosphate isomerase, partial [bacterium]
LCIGEKLEERDSGNTEKVLEQQLVGSLNGIEISSPDRLILAYEPVWAIGTGRVATPEQAQEAQFFVRNWIKKSYGGLADGIRILYGGSVKPGNASDLLAQPDIDGALIGGASLKIESFCEIIAIAKKITEEGK